MVNDQSILDKLDDAEKEILRFIQEKCADRKLKEIRRVVEANLSSKGIHKRVPISTIHSKIKKMEELGIIMSRRAILNHKKLGMGITAFISINYERIRKEEKVKRGKTAKILVNKIRGLPGVQEIHTLAGESDILVKIRAKSVESLARIVLDKIREWDGINRSVTSIVFRTDYETTKIEIDRNSRAHRRE